MGEETTMQLGAPPGTSRLMLLDTYGLVYRAFFALPALTTTRGVPINAAYGFTMMVTKIINDEKPTHVIAAFDRGIPKARVALYKDYKAQRQETPDELRSQFALVRKILATYGIPIVEIDNEEADDVIATLARQAEDAQQQVLVVTGDLDLLQVVDDRTTVLTTRRGITELGRYDEAAVRERFDLAPRQLPDYRGLKGDPSDNLPGIPGVGEKTAIKLIKNAGSLDALIAQPALAGTPKLEALIREFGEQARVCRDVSLVKRDLPLTLDWESAAYAAPANDALYALYRELEFKTLLARLEPPEAPPPIASDEQLAGAYESYTAITDPPDFAKLAALIDDAAARERVAVAMRGDAVAISVDDGRGFAFLRSALEVDAVAGAFAHVWERVPHLIAYDVKSEIGALALPLRFAGDDPMLAAHLLNPSRTFADVGQAAGEFLDRVLPDEPASAADAAGRLAHTTRAELERRGQHALYADVELPLATVLAGMERAGVALDLATLRELAVQVDADVARLQHEIYDLAGEEFNLGSPQQLGRILFDKLNLPAGKRNKTGWSTDDAELQRLRGFPIAQKIQEYREVSKLKNTYIDVFPTLLDARGRLHTVFRQTATATGRLSSTNPNLQNIPVRSDLGRLIRKAFVAPSPDRVLLAADYSQIELRLMAHLSGDEAMRTAFHEHQDIHDFTARRIFDIGPFAEVDPNQRRMAKAVNFGLLYGMSDFGLAQRLEIDRAAAKQMSQAYFDRFPGVRGFIDRSLEEARERGYVQTILGRRRYMPDLRAKNYALRAAAEREATNAPLQGSAADLMKLAMVRLDRRLAAERLDAVMLLQIHDELIFEVARTDLDAVARVVKHEMEHALELSVPIEATLKSGANWYDVASFDVEADELEAAASA
ncbi:DNA polymerase [Vulcanimicrobium alpinum]|uniref:DNA polymerase I n=1 Tax=Vulcanimicrobium alpinum TaxID=3016050 RepID=A0AAN1XZ24_UNVUL|nr:DNA polymerase I [Vulcanimicrobium alpinum]BDE07999.1 DNA polymerase [Vulcanimicrobium alpinum]